MSPKAAWRVPGGTAMGNDRRRRDGLALAAALAAGTAAGLALPPLGALPLLWPALAVLWALAGSPPSSGRPATVAWYADSFGHSAGLPEVFAAAGLRGFAFTRPGAERLREGKGKAPGKPGPKGGKPVAVDATDY